MQTSLDPAIVDLLTSMLPNLTLATGHSEWLDDEKRERLVVAIGCNHSMARDGKTAMLESVITGRSVMSRSSDLT